MLGLRRATRPSWSWFATGKLPCARDFFSLGESFPLARGLAQWVERGYLDGVRARGRAEPVSWRFWVRGGGKDAVAFGVVADSADALARPFPVLVVGQGAVAGWEARWEDLPRVLLEHWLSLEAMLAVQCGDLGALGSLLSARSAREIGVPAGIAAAASDATLAERIAEALERDREAVVLDLPGHPGEGALAAAHALLKDKVARPPNAVFIGGGARHPRIIFFYRPLTATDFATVWWQRGEEGAKT